MKITDVRTVRVNIPFAKPLRTSIHSFECAGCVLVFMDTDEGITGESYVFSLNIPRLKVFEAMIQSFKPEVVGEDPHYTEKIWQKIWQDINFFGHKGLPYLAFRRSMWRAGISRGKPPESPSTKWLGPSGIRSPSMPAGASGFPKRSTNW